MEQEPESPSPDRSELTLAARAVVLIAVLVVLGVITYLGPILKPFFIAVFLFFPTKAAGDALVRHRFPPLLAYLTLFLLAVALAAILGLFVYRQAQAFRADWPQYQERAATLIGDDGSGTGHSVQKLFEESAQTGFKFLFETGVHLVELLLMTFFYLLFLLLGSQKLAGRLQRAFSAARAEQLARIIEGISTGMEQFIKVKTLVSVGLGVTSALLLLAFGVNQWLLWGFLFCALNYITYIGSVAACLPPIAVAYLDLDPVLATILAALLVVNRVLWIDWVEIRLSGKHLNIDSVLLFLWLAYWGWAWGVIGLILAFPMITSLRIILEHIESTRHWAGLMAEE